MRRVLLGLIVLAAALVQAVDPLPASAAAAANPWPHEVINGFSTPTGDGFWLIYADGTVEAHGDATHHGDASHLVLVDPVVGGTATPTGNGYWLVARDGGIFSFGDAPFLGSMGGVALNEPVFSMAATPTANGYWLVARDGGIFSFGDARFFGSMGGIALAQPATGITTSPSGNGYRIVAKDGGIFSFGDVAFHGSLPGLGLTVDNSAGMAPSQSGDGYWIAQADGSVVPFGDAATQSGFDALYCDPVSAIFSSPTADGYRLVLQSGRSLGFGAAPGGTGETGTGAVDCTLAAADCQLPHRALNSEVKVGWPRSTNRLPSIGTARLAVLFVDFSDAPAAGSTTDRFHQGGFSDAEAFLESQSFGVFDIEYVPHHTWMRMSLRSDEYGINRGLVLFELFAYLDEAVELADPSFDFSNIDGVIAVPAPSAVALSSSPAFVAHHPAWGIEADGATIMSGFARGTDWDNNDAEVIYHELGHTLGLVDAYDRNQGWPSLHRFVGIFDPMGSLAPDEGGNEMFAWHRWQLGWLDDSQIHCTADMPDPILISPVASQGGTDAVVVPVSSTSAIVVESRRAIGADSALAETGVLVYRVDSATTSGHGPIEVLGDHPSSGPDATALLQPGESLTADGVTVTVHGADTNGDTVSVSR
ncbi:MAG: hypothetical protein GY925_00255 [Actinomycetia bacterium]|nr:hypothetical protein [Actinomycetes bacterium]